MKENINNNNNVIMTPSPLKIKKDSHFIKKSSPPPLSPSLTLSSSSSSSTLANSTVITTQMPTPARTPPRHPVIIYTHSPKVIHTNPKDFMALVQKLTGFSRAEDDDHHAHDRDLHPPNAKIEPQNILDKDDKMINPIDHSNNNKSSAACIMNDDNDTTSVITDENGSSTVGDGVQVNSIYFPQNFDTPLHPPPNPYFNNVPFYNSNATHDHFSSVQQSFFNYSDSLLMMPNMRSSMSSPTLESLKELSEF